MILTEEGYLEFDYGNHPAFKDFIGKDYGNTKEILHLFKELDLAVKFVVEAKEALPASYINHYFDTFISSLFQRIENISLSYMGESAFKGVVVASLQQTKEFLKEYVEYENSKKTSSYTVTINPMTKKIEEDFQTQGFTLGKIPQEYIDILFEHTKNYRDEVEKKIANNPLERQPGVIIPSDTPIFELVKELLKSIGFVDGISLYHKHQMNPIYCFLQGSHPQESWFKECYSDIGLPSSQLTYLHFDHDIDVVKAIIYLNEVAIENGAFSIIPASRNLFESITQTIFYRCFDKVSNKFVREELKLDCNYYRPVFKHQQLRREFAKMPKELQGSSHFGDDILDDTPAANFLLSNEFILTSSVGNAIAFSGGATLHRGGWVQRGRRWVMQIAFRKE